MNINNFYENEMGIHSKILNIVESVQEQLNGIFKNIELTSEYLQGKLIKLMGECRISARHFQPSTGYGYGDESRERLEELFALVFGSEDALVRPQWVSGTHVISDALFAVLRPGDTLLSITGKPYDTLEDTIGIENNSGKGSLADWGIEYDQVELTISGKINIDKVFKAMEERPTKAILIQRSRGYEWRPSIPIDEIQYAIKRIKERHPEVFIIIDNCYGEFTEKIEPSHVGADLTVGSLIKNPGGGMAPTGGYAVGTTEAIELLSYRLTSPSIGREVGSYSDSYLPFYQGLFMAPHIVAEALKGATLVAKVFESLGYEVLPHWQDKRSDIIQCIRFSSDEELITFCQAIQSASPVDGHVTPYPWEMPGYSHKVIMAAGTFVQGASIELSADAPIKPPYTAYLQGGLTYAHVKFALLYALTKLNHKGYLSL